MVKTAKTSLAVRLRARPATLLPVGLAAAVSLAGLVACGQRGPLILPAASASAAVSAPASAASAAR